MYWWENKIETSEEVLLYLKSTQIQLDKITSFVKENHTYKVPEVISFKVIFKWNVVNV